MLKEQKGHFPEMFKGFLFLSQSTFSKILLFFLLFSFFFCLPFQNSTFAFFLSPINPFSENVTVFLLLYGSLFSSLSLLHFCFFPSNKLPDIPFSSPSCFHVWLLCYYYCSFLSFFGPMVVFNRTILEPS